MMLDGGVAASRELRDSPQDAEQRALCVVNNLTVEAVGDAERKVVIQDISFQIRKGEYFALVGESGSGKSVTCHALMQLLPFRANVSGRVVVDEADVFSLKGAGLRDFRRRSVGMIFQDPLAALNPVRTVGSQLTESLRLHYPSARRDELRARAVGALTGVHITQPELRLACYPHQLSGGLNQRVMIALALLGRPPLLIADEPTTALDMSVQAEILDLLDELRQSIGLSVLMVTHDLGIVADRATSIAVMKSGRIVESGDAATVLSAPREAYTKALFEASMVTRPSVARQQDKRARVCLSFDRVSKTFRSHGAFGARRNAEAVVAADDVSFTVAEGEIVALVGESGSGKTTAAKMAMGLVRPDSGKVAIAHGAHAPSDKVGAQLVFQHPKDSLDPLMKVGAQLHEVLKVHGNHGAEERSALIRSVLADVGLDETLLDRRPTYLSGGEAQRVVIARALLLQPKLLIADEPLSAVDVCLQKQILECFRSLREKRGIAILLITHDLRVVLEIADRVIVMQNGCLVERVPIEKFFDGQRNPYTQKLIDAMPGRDFHPSDALDVERARASG
jgi:ABC-type glutathione transport system ATPase component